MAAHRCGTESCQDAGAHSWSQGALGWRLTHDSRVHILFLPPRPPFIRIISTELLALAMCCNFATRQIVGPWPWQVTAEQLQYFWKTRARLYVDWRYDIMRWTMPCRSTSIASVSPLAPYACCWRTPLTWKGQLKGFFVCITDATTAAQFDEAWRSRHPLWGVRAHGAYCNILPLTSGSAAPVRWWTDGS